MLSLFFYRILRFALGEAVMDRDGEPEPFLKYFTISTIFALASLLAFPALVAATFFFPRGEVVVWLDSSNATSPLGFIAESTAWTMIHLLENYVACAVLTSVALELLKERARALRWAVTIGLGLAIAMLWEMFEAFWTVVFKVLVAWGLNGWLPNGVIYGSLESPENSLLSDGAQAISGNALFLLTAELGVVARPPSYDLLRSGRWRAPLRLAVLALQLMDFVHVLQVRSMGRVWRTCFWALLFWKAASLWALYAYDLWDSHWSGRGCSGINRTYAFLGLFHVAMWCSVACGLLPPLIMSNAFGWGVVLASAAAIALWGVLARRRAER